MATSSGSSLRRLKVVLLVAAVLGALIATLLTGTLAPAAQAKDDIKGKVGKISKRHKIVGSHYNLCAPGSGISPIVIPPGGAPLPPPLTNIPCWYPALHATGKVVVKKAPRLSKKQRKKKPKKYKKLQKKAQRVTLETFFAVSWTGRDNDWTIYPAWKQTKTIKKKKKTAKFGSWWDARADYGYHTVMYRVTWRVKKKKKWKKIGQRIHVNQRYACGTVKDFRSYCKKYKTAVWLNNPQA